MHSVTKRFVNLGGVYRFVENKEKVVSNDSKSNHAKIVERQKKTCAKTVKTQNREYVEEMKQHLTPASSH